MEIAGKLVGCVLGVVVRLGFMHRFGSPLPGWQTPSMGPVFDRRRVTTQELATSLIVFLERRYGVQHIELMGNDFEAEARSEEHTSELQSRLHLVCRLLLEKKK